jgi:hypothetical protein
MLIRFFAATLGLWVLATLSAAAQTDYYTASPKRAARKELRAAKRYPAAEDLRKTHLNVGKRALRPGESPAQNLEDGSERYQYENNGTRSVDGMRIVDTRRPKKQPKAAQ